VNDITASTEEKREIVMRTLTRLQTCCQSVSVVYDIVVEMLELALSAISFESDRDERTEEALVVVEVLPPAPEVPSPTHRQASLRIKATI
jgi:hypothetical protein